MGWENLRKLSLKKKVQTDGQFVGCPGCDEHLFKKKLDDNLSVCYECGHHLRIPARRRVEITLDPDTFEERFGDMKSGDPLGFAAGKKYADRLTKAEKETGLKEAVLAGKGKINGIGLVIVVTDSFFLMGSMGSVVGEKITRAIELATEERLPLVIFSGSGGGARMYEGVFSLMQMIKTSAALARHDKAGGLFISVLTNPTMGGAMASFASLGDVTLAEPNAILGFTGPRVIRETLRVELPPDFQDSNFQLKHGQVDRIVPRLQMRDELTAILKYCGKG